MNDFRVGDVVTYQGRPYRLTSILDGGRGFLVDETRDPFVTSFFPTPPLSELALVGHALEDGWPAETADGWEG